MSISAIRFRAEGELLVLQVCEHTRGDNYYGTREKAEWRDAKVTDLLNVAPFTSDWRALADRVSEISQQVNVSRVEQWGEQQ
jgi:hypothetical protein